jgi:TolB-like protein
MRRARAASFTTTPSVRVESYTVRMTDRSIARRTLAENGRTVAGPCNLVRMRISAATAALFPAVVTLLGAAGAAAFEDGDVCKLKAPLEITVRSRAGQVRAQVEAGQEVEVRGVGDTTLRVHAGETEGLVAATDLEAACAGSLRLCRVADTVVLVERTDGTGRSFRIKAGADLSVLREGREWGQVRIGDLEGYVKSDELGVRCKTEGGGGEASAGAEEPVSSDRADGPGVLVVPFYVASGDVSEKVADALSTALFDELGVYRPDAVLADQALLAKDKQIRTLPLKPAQADAAKRAQSAGLAYAVTGRLERAGEGYVLSVVVVEAKTGKVVKAVKARPTVAAEDPWATAALAVLLPGVAPAPGSKVPKPPVRKGG